MVGAAGADDCTGGFWFGADTPVFVSSVTGGEVV